MFLLLNVGVFLLLLLLLWC